MADSAVGRRQQPLVLFAGMGASGQYNPLFSVASAFVQANRDVRVVFATWASKEDEVRAAGMEFLAAWPLGDGAGKPGDPIYDLGTVFNASGPRNADTLLFWTLVSRCQSMYGDALAILLPWMEEHKPDLAVCDILSEATMAAAIRSHTPFVINTPVPPLVLLPESKPKLYPPLASAVSRLPKPLTTRLWNAGAVTLYGLNIVRRLYPVLKQHVREGIPLPSETGRQARGVLYNTAPQLSDPRIRFPSKVTFTGAVMRPNDAALTDPDAFRAAWAAARREAADKHDDEAVQLYAWVDEAAAAGTPIVFIGLGTIYRLDVERVQAMYDALEALPSPVRVVWKLSADEQGLLPPRAPSNPAFRILRWIPSVNLLLAHPGVRLFVNHGGGNSMNEGLCFAKPQVLLPAWLDCFDFAIQCHDAGAGIAITTAPHLAQADFYDAVKRVLFDPGHEQFAQRAHEIAAQMRELGGSLTAAHVIRTILDESTSSQPDASAAAPAAAPTEPQAHALGEEEATALPQPALTAQAAA